MARTLERSASTISREVTRNACACRGYASTPARALSQARRLDARPSPKLAPEGALWEKLLTLLDWEWSHQQIAGMPRRV